jgi:hypothetical protein
MKDKVLDSRFRGNDELIRALLTEIELPQF